MVDDILVSHCMAIRKFDQICRFCYSEEPLFDIALTKYRQDIISTIAESLILTELKNGNGFELPMYACIKCINGIIQAKLLKDQLHRANERLKILVNTGVLTESPDCRYVTLKEAFLWHRDISQHLKLVWITGTPTNVNEISLVQPEKLHLDNGFPEGNPEDTYNNDSDSDCNETNIENVKTNVKETERTKPDDKLVNIEPELLQVLQIELSSESEFDMEFDSDIDCMVNFDLKTRKKKERASHQKEFVCPEPECDGKAFNGFSAYRTHRNALHPQVIKCPECDRIFLSRASYTTHKYSHRFITCELCNKRLRMSSYGEHRKNHNEEYKFSKKKIPYKRKRALCTICGKLYRLGTNIHACNIVTKKYKCDQCDFKTGHYTNFIRHKEVHDPDKRYLCVSCGSGFRQKNSMDVHRKLHDPLEIPVKCIHCNSLFYTKYELRSHVTTVHSVKRTISQNGETGKSKKKVYTYMTPCLVCPHICKSRAELVVHMRVHTKERPYKCDQCPKAFTQKPHLNHHKLKVHDSSNILNQFPCLICGKVLRSTQTLQDHIRIHTGETMACDYCGEQFKHTSNKFRHLREVHGIRSYGQFKYQ